MDSVTDSKDFFALSYGYFVKQVDALELDGSLGFSGSKNCWKEVDRVGKVLALLCLKFLWPRNHDGRANAIFERRAFRSLSEAFPELLVRVVQIATSGRPPIITDIEHEGVLRNFLFIEMVQ